MAVTSDGQFIYVAGDVSESVNGRTWSGSVDIVLLKYSSAGDLQWTKQSGTSSEDTCNGVSASADGQSVYVVGTTQGNLDGQINSGNY